MRPLQALAATLALALLAGCTAPLQPASPAAAPGGRLAAEPFSLAASKPNVETETAVAFDPLDPLHVAVFHIERTRPYATGSGLLEPRTPGLIAETLAVSQDGGATWASHPLPQAGSAAPGSAWGLYCTLADPNLFFDRAGVLHIVTLGVSCSAPGYLVGAYNGPLHATTEDGGATWSEPQRLALGAGGFLGVTIDRPWTAYDPASDAVLVAWSRFTGATATQVVLTAARSADGGRTWSETEDVFAHPALGPAQNFLVHALFTQGQARITTLGCPDASGIGGCLWSFTDAASGWERAELPLAACPAQGQGAGYATAAAHDATRRAFAATELQGGSFQGEAVCVFASQDGGATWPAAAVLEGADHPWLDVAPDGSPLLAFVALEGEQGVPTLALLDPATLQVVERLAVGPAFPLDPEGDGVRDYGHYDQMAASSGRWLWALTQPNAEGRAFDGASADLDIAAYHGTVR